MAPPVIGTSIRIKLLRDVASFKAEQIVDVNSQSLRELGLKSGLDYDPIGTHPTPKACQFEPVVATHLAAKAKAQEAARVAAEAQARAQADTDAAAAAKAASEAAAEAQAKADTEAAAAAKAASEEASAQADKV